MKIFTKKSSVLLVSTAMAIALSAGATNAFAQSADTAAMEARLKQLEASMNDLQAQLAKAKAAPTMAAPAPAASTSGGPVVKFGGFIKTVGTFSSFSDGELGANSTGRDFYVGQAIPTNAGKRSQVFDAHAKQTRLTASVSHEIAGHTLKGYIEGDFQVAPANGVANSERVTNPYNPGIRRAYIQVDNLTIGQDWSTFQNMAVLPESTDYAGTLDGTVFQRQALVRLTQKLSPNVTGMISLENASVETASMAGALGDANSNKIPDVAGRLAIKTKVGEFSVAGLVRQLNVRTGLVDSSATAGGVSVSGVMPFGEKSANKFTFMATYGDGIGRYVAAGASPDTIVDGTGKLHSVHTASAMASVKLVMTPQSRVNLMAGYHSADIPEGILSAAQQSGFTKELSSVAANYFYSPLKNVDFGVEYRHAIHKRFGGAQGTLDRIEFAAKYSF